MDIKSRFIDFSESEQTVDSDTRMIRGYAAKFDSVSEPLLGIREVILHGFFRKALGEKFPIYALFDHRSEYILGERNAGTLRLYEDRRGLYYEVDLPESRLVRDLVLSPIKRGELRGCSFRFLTFDDGVRYNRSIDTFELVPDGCERLLDVGPVTYPAYHDTEIEARALELKTRQPEKRPENNIEQLKLQLLRFQCEI